MLEKYGDIFEQDCDVVVVTTNGFTKKNGECVMGKGIAKTVQEYYPEIATKLGSLIQSKGNVVHCLYDTTEQPGIVSFPVKPKTIVNNGSNCVSHCKTRVGTVTAGFLAQAQIDLIKRSLEQLVELADKNPNWDRIICPQFGCGAGELSWDKIKPIAELILDNRFIVMTFDKPTVKEKEEDSNLYYTGIGSRDTPKDILELMAKLAVRIEAKGYILRSGGADGADSAFAKAVSNKHIYLPWYGFNGLHHSTLTEPEEWTFEQAAKVHPAWDRCKQAVRKLHARNIHQIKGHGSNPKLSSFVICWTPNGKEVGGTATAIKLANLLNIPVCNLGNPKQLEVMKDLLK